MSVLGDEMWHQQPCGHLSPSLSLSLSLSLAAAGVGAASGDIVLWRPPCHLRGNDRRGARLSPPLPGLPHCSP